MKASRIAAIVLLALAYAVPAVAGTPSVPARLYEQADSTGKVRALVRLRACEKIPTALSDFGLTAPRSRAMKSETCDARR